MYVGLYPTTLFLSITCVQTFIFDHCLDNDLSRTYRLQITLVDQYSMLALFVIIALPGKYVKYIVLYLTALLAGHAPARNTSVTFAFSAQHELSAKKQLNTT